MLKQMSTCRRKNRNYPCLSVFIVDLIYIFTSKKLLKSNMKKNSLFLVFSTILSVFNAFATDYYIDPLHANDQNNGLSSTSAFKALFKIDNIALQPGDTVFFMEGTYERPNEILLTINGIRYRKQLHYFYKF